MTTALVIDDETDINLENTLNVIRPFFDQVLTCRGNDGIKTVRSVKPDAVFISLVLENANGLGIMKAIRSQFPKMYIVATVPEFIASSFGIKNEISILADGASRFLKKPLQTRAMYGINSRIEYLKEDS